MDKIVEKAKYQKLLPYGLTGYANNNFVKDPKDCKSVIGYCFFLNKVVVFLNSKKQKTIFISTIKVKYITLNHSTRELIWIWQFINKMELKIVKDITLYINNKISIALIKNAESQHCIKFINIQYNYIYELVHEEELTDKWIPGSKILADRKTKTLPTEMFKRY